MVMNYVGQKLVIIEDQAMVCELLCEKCARYGIAVVNSAGYGKQGVELVLRTTPDIVLVDIQLPDMDGFTVVELIKDAGVTSRIILMSGSCNSYTTYRAERLKIHGFIDKISTGSDTLLLALQRVSMGEYYYSDGFKNAQAARRSDPHSFDKLLTNAEQKILQMVAYSADNERISASMNITMETLNRHMYNIRQKLNLHSRSDLICYARSYGFVLSTENR